MLEMQLSNGVSILKDEYRTTPAIPDPKLKIERTHVQNPYRGPLGRSAGAMIVYRANICIRKAWIAFNESASPNAPPEVAPARRDKYVARVWTILEMMQTIPVKASNARLLWTACKL